MHEGSLEYVMLAEKCTTYCLCREVVVAYIQIKSTRVFFLKYRSLEKVFHTESREKVSVTYLFEPFTTAFNCTLALALFLLLLRACLSTLMLIMLTPPTKKEDYK